MEDYLKVNNWINQNFPCLHNFELTHLQRHDSQTKRTRWFTLYEGPKGQLPFSYMEEFLKDMKLISIHNISFKFNILMKKYLKN